MFKIENYLNNHSPGYVIETYKAGEIKEYIFGNKCILPKIEKTTSDTLYDIASLTKVYTAVLIYMAYEEHKLDLNDTIYSLDNNFADLKQVKIIDLLSHNQDIWTKGYLGNCKTKNEFYKILYTAYVKSNTPTYVDTHYIILTIILEKIYHKSYKELCVEKIFNKLHLSKTTFDPDYKLCASNNYEHQQDTIITDIFPGLIHDTKGRTAKELGIYLGHASIFTTGKDLLNFLISFLNTSLLKPETIKLMLEHRNTNEINYKYLNRIYGNLDINEMYEKYIKEYPPSNIQKTYNNMSCRYKNDIALLNDVPLLANNSTITFSGYTGPMFVIDFDNKIIIIIMCNVIHNSKLNREERKKITVDIMNEIYKKLLK